MKHFKDLEQMKFGSAMLMIFLASGNFGFWQDSVYAGLFMAAVLIFWHGEK